MLYGHYLPYYTPLMAWPQLAQTIHYVDEINPAAGLAHVALDDHNLDDETLIWLIETFIPEHRTEYMVDNSSCSEQDVDSLIAFLRWLLTVPSAIRAVPLEGDE